LLDRDRKSRLLCSRTTPNHPLCGCGRVGTDLASRIEFGVEKHREGGNRDDDGEKTGEGAEDEVVVVGHNM